MAELSRGIVARVSNSSEEDNFLSQSPAVVQVLGVKRLSEGSTSYRMCLSDGIHRLSSVLFRPKPGNVKPPTANSIIDVGSGRSYLERIRDRVAWFVDEYREISPKNTVIGDPINYSQESSTPENRRPKQDPSPDTPTKAQPETFDPSTSGSAEVKRKLSFATSSTHEIKSLNPYINKYRILCRVTAKCPLRKWSNSKGEGTVFNVTLEDGSGEIQATGFNDVATKLYSNFVEGKVYSISGAQIKPVRDRRFNNTGHNYEMGLTEHTIVKRVDESTTSIPNLPELKLNTVKFSDIESLPVNEGIDVIGIVGKIGNVEEISVNKGSRTALKREIALIDDSNEGTSIAVTLWDERTKMESTIKAEETIIAFRGAKVSEWKGKTLNIGGGSSMIIDPASTDAERLKIWWNSSDRREKDFSIRSLSQSSTKIDTTMENLITLEEIKIEFKSSVDEGKTGIYTLWPVYVTEIKRDKMMFRSCENCSKKISEPVKRSEEEGENGEVYKCKSCNTHSRSFSWRYVLNIGLADLSGNHWATVFDPCAQKLLGGKSAKDLNLMLDGEYRRLENFLSEHQYTRWKMKVKARVENWNQEMRLKLIVTELDEVDIKTEQERFKKEILLLEKKYSSDTD